MYMGEPRVSLGARSAVVVGWGRCQCGIAGACGLHHPDVAHGFATSTGVACGVLGAQPFRNWTAPVHSISYWLVLGSSVLTG